MLNLNLNLNTNYQYIICPFFTWVLCGGAKFFIMGIKNKSFSFSNNGYGGFPSNHSSIVSAISFLVFLNQGLCMELGICLSFGFLVILDALGLRKKVETLVVEVNKLRDNNINIKERTGHSWIEVLGGILTGIISSSMLYYIFRII